MAEAPAPAPPEIETERTVRWDEVPVAETALEPPYRVLIHNGIAAAPLRPGPHRRLFGLAAPA